MNHNTPWTTAAGQWIQDLQERSKKAETMGEREDLLRELYYAELELTKAIDETRLLRRCFFLTATEHPIEAENDA
jgi:hypothetical protein